MPHPFDGQLAAVLRHAERPLRIPVPDIDEDRIVGHVEIVVARTVVRTPRPLRENLDHGRRVEFTHLVHVVGAELLVAILTDTLVVPVQLAAIGLVNGVTGRRPVLANPDARQFAGPPPRLADGGDIVFENRSPLHIGIVMGMSRQKVDVRESFETIEQLLRFPRGIETLPILERRVVVVHRRTVHPHDHGLRLVAQGRQIVAQPCQLLVGHIGVVVAFAHRTFGAARIDVNRVVEHDVVHFAHVERVIGRTQRLAVGRFGGEITGEIGIVVVVAHRVVDRHGIPLHRSAVVAQAVKIGVPELVPRHVAQHHQIGRHALCRSEGRRLGDKPLGELPEVVRAVGEVHVAEHEDFVGVLAVDLFEFEIGSFDDTGAVFERAVELREHAVARNFVAARNGDEDISPFLGRFELVDALLVRDGHFRAVGHYDVFHADAGRRHDPVDRGARIRFETYVLDDVDVDSSERFFARVPFDEDFVVTRFTPVGQAYGETFGRGVDDGADIRDACVRLKNECVSG